jgi:Glycosyltransferase family 87
LGLVKLKGNVEQGKVAGASGRLRLPGELRWFWMISLAGFGMMFLVGWLKYCAGETQFNWDPLSDPLFGDMAEYPGTYTLLHTADFFFNVAGHPWAYPMFSPVAYPPFAALIMAPMYGCGQPELAFLLVAAGWLVALVGWVSRGLTRIGMGRATAILLPLSLVLISFPIQRMMHQGNIELVLWMFTALGALAFIRGRDDAAAVLWGLAAAMKLFPIILLILLLPRRKWRAFAEGVGTFLLASVFALWWLGPSIAVAWKGSMQNVFGYQGVRMGEFSLRELVANHSLIDLAKIVAMILHYPLNKLMLPYFACGAAVMGLAFFGKLWKMPVANQLLAVSAFMVMFPSISYYHALVHMYAPLLLLGWIAIQAQRTGISVKGLGGTIMLFVPLFVAFPVLTFPKAILYCGVIQSLVLLMLFFCALEYPFAMPAGEGRQVEA